MARKKDKDTPKMHRSNIGLEDIEKRFLHWIEVAKKRTGALVEKHWNMIDILTLKLVEQEIVENDELLRIIGKKKISFNIPQSL